MSNLIAFEQAQNAHNFRGEFHRVGKAVVSNGYDIVPIKAGSKRPTVPNWNATDFNQSPETRKATGCGLGVKTKFTPAVDIDVLDKEVTEALTALLDEVIGETPYRTGKAPKRLHIFKTSMPYSKILSKQYEDEQGNKHRVEILADGQQFVAYGEHPDTNKPYQWSDGDLVDTRHSELPELSEAQALAFITRAEQLIEEMRPIWTVKQNRPEKPRLRKTNLSDCSDLNPERVSEALKKIDPDTDHDTWVKVGMALHSTGQQWAFDLFDSWSRGDLNNAVADKYDYYVLVDKWNSFKEDKGITIGTLFYIADPKEPDAEPEPIMADNADDLMDELFGDFMLTDEQIEEIADPEWAYENLIVEGHLTIVASPANGGKTTVLNYIAGELAKEGYKVNYFNADVGAGDSKYYYHYAKKHGFNLYLPDMGVGGGMIGVIEQLKRLNDAGHSLKGHIFFFDTLKKMADMINKSDVKNLLALFRKLTAKQATVVCLAHTNKYHDKDDKPVFEGTGDIRNDVDELIYFNPVKNADGSMTVSTFNDKVRADFTSALTFNIDADRTVELSEQFVDTYDASKRQAYRDKNADVIEAIKVALSNGERNQSEIVELVKSGMTASKSRITRTLGMFDGADWVCRIELRNNNTHWYRLID